MAKLFRVSKCPIYTTLGFLYRKPAATKICCCIHFDDLQSTNMLGFILRFWGWSLIKVVHNYEYSLTSKEKPSLFFFYKKKCHRSSNIMNPTKNRIFQNDIVHIKQMTFSSWKMLRYICLIIRGSSEYTTVIFPHPSHICPCPKIS